MTAAEMIARAIKMHGPLRLRGLVKHTGLPLGTVSNAVWRMQQAGTLAQARRIRSSRHPHRFLAVVYCLGRYKAPRSKAPPAPMPRVSSIFELGVAVAASREL